MIHQDASVSGDDAANRSPADSNSSHSAAANSADAETTATPQDTVEGKSDATKEIERLTLELNEWKDRYLRSVAEMDNMRKRLDREKQDFLKFSNEGILKDMIPVLDSIEKAIPNDEAKADTAVASYKDGVQMVYKQFMQVLAKHGLEPVAAIDCPFDPNFHQAIQRIEDAQVKVDTVVAEFAKGYVLHGRLIRPSIVSVKVAN